MLKGVSEFLAISVSLKIPQKEKIPTAVFSAAIAAATAAAVAAAAAAAARPRRRRRR